MSLTRFHDDPCRIIKQNQQSTDPGRWILDVPGNGDNPCYMADPHIIPQKWGGNLYTHTTDLNSQLRGLSIPLNRDNCIAPTPPISSAPTSYPVCDTLSTEQSRAIMPAWTMRDLDQIKWDMPRGDVQRHTQMPFNNNVSTRVMEKSLFNRSFDCVPSNPQQYLSLPVQTVSESSLCTSSNSCSAPQI